MGKNKIESLKSVMDIAAWIFLFGLAVITLSRWTMYGRAVKEQWLR